ncbi:MAG: hypothetical protein II820_07820 [Ruminiclostridium sp.]|nr:hypothetical protein [Ruminiclostridium sp.]
MVIYTYGHEYPVTSVHKSTDVYSCYICTDNRNGGFCRIMSIKDKSLFPELVGWLSSTVDPAVFTDYIEHFMFDDTLCIVMKYTQGITLADRNDTEAAPLRERLELCRKILERAVLMDIPDYFLDRCLDTHNIIVAHDLTVSFNYPIDDITESRAYHPMIKAEKLLRTIFARELERKVPDELIAFFDKMPELIGSDKIELYSRYYMMMTAVTERDAGEEEPKSFWYKLWDKIKEIWVTLKKILMFLLLAAAAVYLIFTINTSGSSKNSQPNFDSIGTVTIDKTR